jgi:hypothetical protein
MSAASDSRQRGVTLVPMPEAVNGPAADEYALLVRPDGAMRMVHYEGVAYEVTDEKPWRWNDYAPCDVFSPEELRSLVEGIGERVDLADWVRVFGARLESNFWQIVGWYES